MQSSAGSVRRHLKSKLGLDVSASKVRQLLRKNLRYSYRKLKPLQSYVNTAANIESRRIFAQNLIENLERGLVMVNIDECSINCVNKHYRGWVPRQAYAHFHSRL